MPLYFILTVVCSECETILTLWQGEESLSRKHAESWARAAGWKKRAGDWLCPTCLDKGEKS
jgi:hypothetical protein